MTETIVVEPKKSFQDQLPVLLKDNIFDQSITAFRKWTDSLKITDAVDNIVYWNAWAAFRVSFKLLMDWKVYGASNFPEFGSALLISNHQSVIDPFLVGSGVGREVSWMSKIENFEMPIFKSILRKTYCIKGNMLILDEGCCDLFVHKYKRIGYPHLF